MDLTRLVRPVCAACLALAVGCGSRGGSPLQVTAEPGAAVIGCRASLQVRAEGGAPPYSYQLRSGAGAVDPSSGVYTVPPRPGAAVVRVTDAAGASRDVTLTSALPAASTWTTVDDFVAPGGGQAGLVALASDATGTLYAVGFAGSGWTVRRGTDGGTRWETVDTYPSPGAFAGPGGVAAPGAGEVYAGGQLMDFASPGWPCVVRRTLDSGRTWETRVVHQPEGERCVVTFLAAGPDGGLLAGARVEPADGGTSGTWVLRGSFDHGASWTTLDGFAPAPVRGGAGATASPAGLALGPGGRLSVAGSGWDGRRRHWYVRSWAPGDAAWSLEEDLELPDGGGQGPALTAAAGDGAGPAYVAGVADEGFARTRWLVRGQTDAGWATLDDFASPSDAGSWYAVPWAMAVDRAGLPYVAGRYGPGGSSVLHWLVRVPAGSGPGFLTADDFAYPSATTTEAAAVAVTPAGEHFVGGRAWLASAPMTRWLVRKEVPVCQ